MTFHIQSDDKMDRVTVHKHISCPLRIYNPEERSGDDQYFCFHPRQPRGENYCPDGEIPKTCPLIRAPLHIKLGKGITDALDSSSGVDSSGDVDGDPTVGPVSI